MADLGTVVLCPLASDPLPIDAFTASSWTPIDFGNVTLQPLADNVMVVDQFTVVGWTPIGFGQVVATNGLPPIVFTASIAPDGGTTVTTNMVTLEIEASFSGEQPEEMAISVDGGYTWSDWVPYSTTYEIELPPQTTHPTQEVSILVMFR